MNIINKEEKTKLLDNMEWSYSRVNSYITCPRMFYVTYIIGSIAKKNIVSEYDTEDNKWIIDFIVHSKDKNNSKDPITKDLIKDISEKYGDWVVDYIISSSKNNFFSQYGTFIHNIMEMYGKNKIEIEDIVHYYEAKYYSEITEKAPYNRYKDLNKDYFDKGLNYLEKFKGFENEVIGVEKLVKFPLELSNRTISFQGYIDKVEVDKNGEIEIIDYKSKSDFKDDEEYMHYLYQLYLYSIPLFLEYKKYPKRLTFDMFKINKKPVHEFSETELKKSIDWVDDTLNQIYDDDFFMRKVDLENLKKVKSVKTIEKDFFCSNLCSVGVKACKKIQSNLDN